MERLKVSGSTRAAIWLIRFRDYVLLTTNYHLVLSWTCYSNSQFRILSIRHRWKPLWFRTKFSISPGKLATQQFWNSKSNKELWIKKPQARKTSFYYLYNTHSFTFTFLKGTRMTFNAKNVFITTPINQSIF